MKRMGAFSRTVIVRCAVGSVTDYPDDSRAWGDVDAISRLWSAEGIREAVLLASPALAGQVEKLLSQPAIETSFKKRKRLHKSLLKYALRWCSRCTPFGMFAGVALLPVGDEEPLIGKAHVRHVRVAGPVVRRLLELAQAVPHARLYPNPSLTERGDRMVVNVMRAVGDTHTQASIRATGPARLAVESANPTAERRHIEQRVADMYPVAGVTKIRHLVDELLRTEILLCEASRSAFDGDPLASIPDDVQGVTEMRGALARYSSASEPVADGSLDELLRVCATGDAMQGGVHVDLELDISGHVPVCVVEAAHAAIAVLASAMAHESVSPAVEEFSAKFVERYGETLVPFWTAIDEELGVGYPSSYGAPATPSPAAGGGPTFDRRRDLIATLLRRAASDASDTVDLAETDLEGFPEPLGMPSSFDVMLRLHREPDGLRATVSGLGVPGGSAVGRFTAVIPKARAFAQSCVEADAAWWAGQTAGRGILCGVDYIAGTDSINEVAATAQLHPVTLAVNTRPRHPVERVLTLADVYLGYAEGRVRTVLADGTPVSFRQLNMATTRASAKAIRLLREISDAGIRVPYWSWGEAEEVSSHLPEVRYRGVTLVEQRWRCPAPGEPTEATLRKWLSETGVSRYVFAGERDTRLHLDTWQPLHLNLLLDEIVAGNRWLFRAPDPEHLGVVGGAGSGLHSAEVVVTVAAPKTPHVEPDLTGRPLHDPTDDVHRLLLAGGAWTAFAIDLASHSHDRILRAFNDTFPSLAGGWYFVRYRESGRDQLRLRVRRSIVDLAEVLAWLADARLSGRIGDYTIPVYHRELERYGGSRSFTCYERLFCLETMHLTAMLPVVEANPSITSNRLVRPGIETAAGVLIAWLNGLDPSRVDTRQIVDVAVEHYVSELGAMVHEIKRAMRQYLPRTDVVNGMTAALREFWADENQRDAVLTPQVLQSASHMLSIRLGLQRREEFAAMWLIRTEMDRLDRDRSRFT